MSIVERFNKFNLPPERCVIIGSGVLDALGLREAGDVDIVVESGLFDELRKADGWHEGEDDGLPFLIKDDAEVWRSWGRGTGYEFEALFEDGITIDNVRFANPRTVLEWKVSHNRSKDATDIKLLREYLGRE